jgi:dihydrolipoamide dehydrogenase
LSEAGVTSYEGVGPARFVDNHTIALGDGTQLRGERIIIAAGGHARRFPFPGSELAFTHHDVWSLKRLPRSVAVIGGAATGCQLASIFTEFGLEVHLLEVGPNLLGREDAMITSVMDKAFRQRGVQVLTGIGGVERIERLGPERLALWYSKDGESKVLEVEVVILSVGWIGNLEEMDLATAGVETNRGYVVVDDYMRTSVGHIFAAGDITGRMMLVQSGSYDGRIAAENAVLGVGQSYKHQIVPHGGFTDPEYGSVGMTEAEARQVEPDCVVSVVGFSELDRAVIDGRTEGACKLIVSAETHRLMGAHIAGEQALEIVELAAVGMAGDMWVEQLAELELAYPTFTAILGLAARKAVRQLGVMPLSPQWHVLSRPHAEWEQSASFGGQSD